ncbi:MAG: 50S ribosomal protein L19 [Oscillospiraceae bacterium]|nr:50S ribosomal protein L19 [Oscillospiraceae bacterium]
MNALNLIASDCQRKEPLESFNVGDTVIVNVEIKEGEKKRIQVFKGIVICFKGSGVTRNFTVRRVSHGVGVERIFPIHSPNVHSIEIVRRGRVRRAKLYYLRGRVGKAVRVKEKIV